MAPGIRLDPVVRALVALAKDRIVVLDRDGTVLDASVPVLEWLGIERGGLLGRPIGTVLAPGHPIDVGQAADGSAVIDRELSGRDGVLRPVRLFFAAADPATVALRIELQPPATDLTRAEVDEGDAMFRALAESMPAAMFLLDPFDQELPLRIMYANPWASRIYGYTNDEFVGRSIIRLLDTPASAERARFHAERIMQGEPVMFDAEQRHREGKVLTIEVIAKLVPWGSTKAVLGLAADVTERRAVERALQAHDQVGIEAPALTSPSDTVPLNAPAREETILLVEDNDLVRNVAQAVLELEGYTVLAAAQGSEALTICADATRRIDLLITDVIMPGMSGPQLVQRLESLRPGLKALFISGYRRDDAMPRSGLRKGHLFLQKPFTGELLARKVREVLDSTV